MAINVFPPKADALQTIFGVDKPIIGVIHSLALPGAPRYKGQSMDEIYEFALAEAKRFKEGGINGIIVENGWDLPFAKPENIGYETIAALSVMADLVQKESGLPVGINVLANAAIASMAVAKASKAWFIRVNQWCNAYVANEGILEGPAAEVMRYRSNLRADSIKIFADVHVKHGSHSICADRSLGEMTKDAEWFDADVLIATGNRTGHATPLSEVVGIKDNTSLPVIVGSGIDLTNAGALLEVANGAIVATSFKRDGVWWNEVDTDRVKRFMDLVYSMRKKC